MRFGPSGGAERSYAPSSTTATWSGTGATSPNSTTCTPTPSATRDNSPSGRDRSHPPVTQEATLLHRHGALLTFDEVKTGFTTGPGGATARYGVVPDIVCLAKALGGGISVAAIGGTAEVMGAIIDGRYEQVGTFNGNPLAMAAARATLAEVLTDETYGRLDRLASSLQQQMEQTVADAGVRWNVVSVGAKGCVIFKPERVRDFRDFLGVDDRYSHAHWLVQHNGGAFLPPWGKVEQWLLSAQHDQADIDLFAQNFRTFVAAVSR